MAERFYQGQGQSGEKKPADIKVAEFSKKLDKVQIAGGGLIAYFVNPALGIGIMAWNGAQHILTDKYIGWRNRRQQQLPQAA